MFEEFKLTYNIEEQKDELPGMVRIGSFQRKTAQIPAFLPFISTNGFCFEINASVKEKVHNQMQYIAFSILLQTNPDLLKLTFVDIGISTNFPFIHRLIIPNVKSITNKVELKEELKNISETARYLSANCLGYDFLHLKEYNQQAEFKEPYIVLFIANFPKDFRDEDVDLIYMLISEASKCGIYVVMSYDKAYFPEMNSFNQERFANLFSITKQMIHLDCTQSIVKLNNFNVQLIQEQFLKYPFFFESYSNQEIDIVIEQICKTSKSKNDNSKNFISIPIGRSGRQEIFFEMGEKADTYHALIAGQTQTGKSTFLNNIICQIAEKYTSDEIRLYLLDYKKGTEFKKYKNHPNVEFLLLDNSRLDYGIKILKRLRDEMDSREELFDKLGETINNISKYNNKAKRKLPRILMIIDEVQQLFISNYSERNEVNGLIKEIAKQGASFGIHMLFCSQSYIDCKIDDDTLSQMKLRIAFKLANGRDCRAILNGDNDTPITLDRFTAVFNSDNGLKDKNIIVKLNNFDENKIPEIISKSFENIKDCVRFKKEIINRENGNKIEIENKKDEYGF